MIRTVGERLKVNFRWTEVMVVGGDEGLEGNAFGVSL